MEHFTVWDIWHTYDNVKVIICLCQARILVSESNIPSTYKRDQSPPPPIQWELSAWSICIHWLNIIPNSRTRVHEQCISLMNVLYRTFRARACESRLICLYFSITFWPILTKLSFTGYKLFCAMRAYCSWSYKQLWFMVLFCGYSGSLLSIHVDG